MEEIVNWIRRYRLRELDWLRRETRALAALLSLSFDASGHARSHTCAVEGCTRTVKRGQKWCAVHRNGELV